MRRFLVFKFSKLAGGFSVFEVKVSFARSLVLIFTYCKSPYESLHKSRANHFSDVLFQLERERKAMLLIRSHREAIRLFFEVMLPPPVHTVFGDVVEKS
jgi:predicted ABC-type transport system involved in lysophospholipase L1 biosynthesis ATPase subunit